MYTTYSAYPNYQYNPTYYSYPYTGGASTYTTASESKTDGDRFIGAGLLAPFLLGGITGAAVAPYFYPRPFYPYPPICCPPYGGMIW
ncbi:MAG: hypothetical protein PHI22_00880 [Bacilli bacterium]|nr:hypothetical protein [Bacilli bacterium]MDD4643490.1 hypothetical protein [Bacilli bacterium]